MAVLPDTDPFGSMWCRGQTEAHGQGRGNPTGLGRQKLGRRAPRQPGHERLRARRKGSTQKGLARSEQSPLQVFLTPKPEAQGQSRLTTTAVLPRNVRYEGSGHSRGGAENETQSSAPQLGRGATARAQGEVSRLKPGSASCSNRPALTGPNSLPPAKSCPF